MSAFNHLENVIKEVLEREKHLLREKHVEIVNEYLEQEESVKRVIFKLVNYRKKKYNRLSSLAEGEDATILEKLNGNKICSCAGPEATNVRGWLDLLKLPELKNIAANYKGINTNQNAEEIKRRILECITTQKTLKMMFEGKKEGNEYEMIIRRCKELTGNIISIECEAQEAMTRVLMLYYKSSMWPEDDTFMRDTILSNMRDSKLNFYEYKIWTKESIWKERETFEEYYKILRREHEIYTILMQDTEEGYNECLKVAYEYMDEGKKELKKNIEDEVTYPWLGRYTKAHVIIRLIHNNTKAAAKLKLYEKQAQMFQFLLEQTSFHRSKRGKWYVELAKTYSRYLHLEERTHSLCLDALRDKYVDKDCINAIKKILLKMGKEVGVELGNYDTNIPTVTIIRSKMPNNTKGKALWVGANEQVDTVENIALEYFTSIPGWKGLHAETTIFTTLFGILFWHVIFDDTVPGVFWSPVQDSPVDLFSSHFYPNRKEKIDSFLQEISSIDRAQTIIKSVFQNHAEKKTSCVGIYWNLYSLEDLLEIVTCIRGNELSKLCFEFCSNYILYRSGAPDLCLWNTIKNRAMFVEIKGENDVLSEKQRMWLDKLYNHLEIGVVVAHIRQRPLKTRTKKRVLNT